MSEAENEEVHISESLPEEKIGDALMFLKSIKSKDSENLFLDERDKKDIDEIIAKTSGL